MRARRGPLRFDSIRVNRREMDAFYSGSSAAYGPAAGGGWGYDSLKNFRQISPAVQTHLKLVSTSSSLPLSFSNVFSSCRGGLVPVVRAYLGFCGVVGCWNVAADSGVLAVWCPKSYGSLGKFWGALRSEPLNFWLVVRWPRVVCPRGF